MRSQTPSGKGAGVAAGEGQPKTNVSTSAEQELSGGASNGPTKEEGTSSATSKEGDSSHEKRAWSWKKPWTSCKEFLKGRLLLQVLLAWLAVACIMLFTATAGTKLLLDDRLQFWKNNKVNEVQPPSELVAGDSEEVTEDKWKFYYIEQAPNRLHVYQLTFGLLTSLGGVAFLVFSYQKRKEDAETLRVEQDKLKHAKDEAEAARKAHQKDLASKDLESSNAMKIHEDQMFQEMRKFRVEEEKTLQDRRRKSDQRRHELFDNAIQQAGSNYPVEQISGLLALKRILREIMEYPIETELSDQQRIVYIRDGIEVIAQIVCVLKRNKPAKNDEELDMNVKTIQITKAPPRARTEEPEETPDNRAIRIVQEHAMKTAVHLRKDLEEFLEATSPEVIDASVTAPASGTEKTNKQTGPRETVNLEGADLHLCNLPGLDLEQFNLSRAVLRGANLAGATLRQANLQQADLENANLEDANLVLANLQRANLKHANLRHTRLGIANLQQADLENASLDYAIIGNTKLQHANLKHANLRHAILGNTQLQHANLKFASLLHTTLKKAKIHQTRMHWLDLRHLERPLEPGEVVVDVTPLLGVFAASPWPHDFIPAQSQGLPADGINNPEKFDPDRLVSKLSRYSPAPFSFDTPRKPFRKTDCIRWSGKPNQWEQ